MGKSLYRPEFKNANEIWPALWLSLRQSHPENRTSRARVGQATEVPSPSNSNAATKGAPNRRNPAQSCSLMAEAETTSALCSSLSPLKKSPGLSPVQQTVSRRRPGAGKCTVCHPTHLTQMRLKAVCASDLLLTTLLYTFMHNCRHATAPAPPDR